MKTSNLTRTNLIAEEQAAIIEDQIGCELTNVITLNKNIPAGRFTISPYTVISPSHHEFKGYNYIVKAVEFDKVTGELTIISRRRWQRSFKMTNYSLQVIGYKLPTTHIQGGYVYGNAQLNYSI